MTDEINETPPAEHENNSQEAGHPEPAEQAPVQALAEQINVSMQQVFSAAQAAQDAVRQSLESHGLKSDIEA